MGQSCRCSPQQPFPVLISCLPTHPPACLPVIPPACLPACPAHLPACLQDGYQQRYFALDSFEAGAEQLKAYCRTLHQNIPDDVRAAVGLL